MSDQNEEENVHKKCKDNVVASVTEVEGPDLDLENGPPTTKEAEPDRPCSRRRRCCCSDCWYPGWFSIEEGDQILDIPATFGPTSWQARLIKFCLMIWFISTLIYKWYLKSDNPVFFLAFLTHWSLILSCLWLIVSFLNSTILPPEQPKHPSDSVSLWIKFCWLLFPAAAHYTIMTTILYWALVYDPTQSIDYVNIFSHLLVMLIWVEGLVINRIPIRWKHLPLPMFTASAYIIWLVIHQFATDIGNPDKYDNNPDTNDDLLYPAVDFESKTAFSSILVTLIVFVVTPLVHWLLWSLSICSIPCNCSSYNRRYITETTGSSSNMAEETTRSTTSANVHIP